MGEHTPHAHHATITLNYLEAGTLLAALDHALCHSATPCEGALRELRPLVDRMSVTFGFPTDRLDRLLKGRRVKKFDALFTPERY